MPPGDLRHAALGMAGARCLLAGVKLGVFEALAEGPRDVRELGTALGCDAAGLRVLLRALADLGLVRCRGELVEATVGGIDPDLIRFLEDEWRWLGELEDRVRHGGADAHHTPQTSGFRERYERALVAALGDTPAELARRIPVTRSPERLLDVGGGHGRVAAAFRERYPDVGADVLDLAAPVAPLAGVRYLLGDLRTADWGEGYDLVLLVLVLRHLDGDECRGALRRARRALLPGGTLAVVEPRPPSARRGEGLRELFHWLASGRPAHTAVRGWMREAGFARVRRLRLESAPATELTVALRT